MTWRPSPPSEDHHVSFLAAAFSAIVAVSTSLPPIPSLPSPSGLLATLDSLLSGVQSPLSGPLAGPLNSVLDSLFGSLPPISL